MSEERIDIVVTDKVDSNAAKSLNNIADAADRGQSALDRLKTALASVNGTALDRLASAMAKVDNAQAKLIGAQARLTNSQNAGSIAAQKVALAQQKVATETARTEAAQARAAAASASAESAAMRLAAAQQRQAQTAATAAAAENALGASVDSMRAKVASGEGSIRGLIAEVQRLNTVSASATPAIGIVDQGIRKTGNAANQTSRAMRQATAANANIIAQIQDIGVSLAGGQNPLLVAIQQGSQLSYIASTMEGGVKALLLSVGRLALAWAPVIAALGLAYFALDAFTDKINDASRNDAFVRSLGLTHKEIKKLGDTSVTMGDTVSATFQVLGENIATAMGVSTDQIKTFWNDTANKILMWMAAAFLGIGAGVYALVKTIGQVVVNIGKMFYNAGVAAKNLFLMSIEFLVNKTIDGVNAIGGAINWLSGAAGLGKVVGTMNHINLGIKGATSGMLAMTEVTPVKSWNEGLQNGMNTLKRIGKIANQNREERLRAKAKDLIADRTPKTAGAGKGRKPAEDHSAEDRVKALDAVNRKLDDELSRMKLLKDERDIQQRMDQITEQLAQKNIVLTKTEAESIQAKVRAAENFKKVQSEMDRLYDEVNGPSEKYKNTLAGIAELQGLGAISAERAAREQAKAKRIYEESIDPLFQMKEQMAQQEASLGRYGDAVAQANYYDQLRQAMIKEYPNMSATYVAGISAEVDELMRRNAELAKGSYIQEQASSLINPAMEQNKFLQNYKGIYAEIDRLRQTDLVNEDSYQMALYALQAKYNEMRLSSTSDFFGALAGITKGGHGAIGVISKAAAVAQATIDGYVAVQKALASAPPPFNYIAAAAVAIKTGSNVAGIMSTNAGSFATGGQFMVEGRSGVDANNINMNVTRGERVTVETPSQQRASDRAADPVVNANTKIVNLFDEKQFVGAMDSDEGERIILNVIRRNPNAISSTLRG